METIIKIVSWVCVIIVAVHGAVSAFFGKSKNLAWLKLKISRIIFFVITVLAACFTIISSYYGDKASAVREKKLDDKLKKAEEALNVANEKVDAANEKLDESVKANEKLKGLVSDQSKSISSLVFNMETSLEGKLRFIRNFEILSSLSKFDRKLNKYHCQICDEGVLVYWFNAENDELKGFYLYTNSQINSVLTKKPLSEEFIKSEGKVYLESDTELFAAYKGVLMRKTPQKSVSTVIHLNAKEEVDRLIKNILVYGYRAIPDTVSIQSWQSSETLEYTGGRRVSFLYEVNPMRSKTKTCNVVLDLKTSFTDSLFGITMEEFVERVISHLRYLKIDPKVTPNMVAFLNAQKIRELGGVYSPFKSQNLSSSDVRVRRNEADGEHIVGYSSQEIKKGRNRVKVIFDGLKIFPMLGDVIGFNNKTNLVGDTISFYLDGELQKYDVIGWNGHDWKLVKKGKYESVTTSFFDLPAMKEFWIEHKTDKSLSLVSVGEVASANNPRREPPRFSGKRFAGKIEVEYIGK